MYLYRAVDSQGNTLELLLSPTRDAEAAKRFARQSVRSLGSSGWYGRGEGNPAGCADRPESQQVSLRIVKKVGTERQNILAKVTAPRVINVDKNAAYPKAITDLKASRILPTSVEL
jgi:transposase, IS6 family